MLSTLAMPPLSTSFLITFFSMSTQGHPPEAIFWVSIYSFSTQLLNSYYVPGTSYLKKFFFQIGHDLLEEADLQTVTGRCEGKVIGGWWGQ